MGKILGIAIKNYGSLKDVKMGQLYSDQAEYRLETWSQSLDLVGMAKAL